MAMTLSMKKCDYNTLVSYIENKMDVILAQYSEYTNNAESRRQIECDMILMMVELMSREAFPAFTVTCDISLNSYPTADIAKEFCVEVNFQHNDDLTLWSCLRWYGVAGQKKYLSAFDRAMKGV